MLVCSYCGNPIAEWQLTRGCCGEVHFEETEECPECGSEETVMELGKDGDYHYCYACKYRWNFEERGIK